jgi:rare lipoprotein A (peptidoglycan hydrolase)
MIVTHARARPSAAALFACMLLAAAATPSARAGEASDGDAPAGASKGQVGVASWYGDRFHGRRTASGEVYDMYAFTAAHRSLPLSTIAEVTNLANGRSITVRINDRGPFSRGRILDVSRAGARALGFVAQGTARVRVRVLGRHAARRGVPAAAGADSAPNATTSAARRRVRGAKPLWPRQVRGR